MQVELEKLEKFLGFRAFGHDTLQFDLPTLQDIIDGYITGYQKGIGNKLLDALYFDLAYDVSYKFELLVRNVKHGMSNDCYITLQFRAHKDFKKFQKVYDEIKNNVHEISEQYKYDQQLMGELFEVLYAERDFSDELKELLEQLFSIELFINERLEKIKRKVIRKLDRGE
jgi:hypothetical protein